MPQFGGMHATVCPWLFVKFKDHPGNLSLPHVDDSHGPEEQKVVLLYGISLVQEQRKCVTD